MNHQQEYLMGALPLEGAELDGVQVVRDPDGVWRYESGWIAIPGARDVTLSERFKPKLIVNPADGKVERVVVSSQDVVDGGDLLDWCLQEGTPVLEGDELVEVLVPYDLWQEHDRVPGELISPEHHGEGAEQELAEAERELREAERRFEEAAEFRADVLRRNADQMTRQEARAITGLSVGRIQQLIRSSRLNANELAALGLFEGGPIKTFKQFQKKARDAGLPDDADFLGELVTDLETRGYLARSDKVGVYITDEGAQTLIAVKTAEAEEE